VVEASLIPPEQKQSRKRKNRSKAPLKTIEESIREARIWWATHVPERSRKMDEARPAKVVLRPWVPGELEKWKRQWNRYDLLGVDDPLSNKRRLRQIAIKQTVKSQQTHIKAKELAEKMKKEEEQKIEELYEKDPDLWYKKRDEVAREATNKAIEWFNQQHAKQASEALAFFRGLDITTPEQRALFLRQLKEEGGHKPLTHRKVGASLRLDIASQFAAWDLNVPGSVIMVMHAKQSKMKPIRYLKIGEEPKGDLEQGYEYTPTWMKEAEVRADIIPTKSIRSLLLSSRKTAQEMAKQIMELDLKILPLHIPRKANEKRRTPWKIPGLRSRMEEAWL